MADRVGWEQGAADSPTIFSRIGSGGILQPHLFSGNAMSNQLLKVILDFDGTLTAEEDQVAELSRRSLVTLATEILHVPIEELKSRYAETKARLLADPARHFWRINGVNTAYCNEGAFILNTTTLQTLLSETEAYAGALAEAFPDPEYDSPSDCTNALFHRHTAEIPPNFRPGASELLEALIDHPRTIPVVLTNSLGDKVRAHLERLGFGGVEILGDTRQYEMDPNWTRTFEHPALGRIQEWEVGGGYRVDLRRPAYYHALLEARSDGSRLAVAADTFSLPGAVPLVMDIPFYLLRTSYTPAWCAEVVEDHPLGTVVEDLAELRRLLQAEVSNSAASSA